MNDFDKELKYTTDMLDLITDAQEMYGKDYKRKLQELEAEYHRNIITSNKAAVEQHVKRNNLLNQKNYIVLCRYHNVLNQECDTDAFWLAPRDPQIGDQVILFDNIVNGIGEYSGVIVDMYELPTDAQKYRTIAAPFNYKPFWCIKYNRENEE
jgi:hypothetical protein